MSSAMRQLKTRYRHLQPGKTQPTAPSGCSSAQTGRWHAAQEQGHTAGQVQPLRRPPTPLPPLTARWPAPALLSSPTLSSRPPAPSLAVLRPPAPSPAALRPPAPALPLAPVLPPAPALLPAPVLPPASPAQELPLSRLTAALRLACAWHGQERASRRTFHRRQWQRQVAAQPAAHVSVHVAQVDSARAGSGGRVARGPHAPAAAQALAMLCCASSERPAPRPRMPSARGAGEANVGGRKAAAEDAAAADAAACRAPPPPSPA